MNGINKILGVALVAQVALVALSWGTAGRSDPAGTARLFSFDAEAVTQFTVTNKPEKDAAPKPLVLAKKGEGWVVASADDYPAKTDKVDEVLGKIAGLKVREPVATQATSHNALKVGERDYDKRVALVAGGETSRLRVGGAKGNAVYVRRDGEDAVYLGRGISAWAISDRASTYIDTTYLKIEEPDRVAVRNPAGSVTLVNGPRGWVVDELPADVQLDDTRIAAFVAAARSVQLIAPVGKTVKPEHGLDAGVVVEIVKGEAVTSYTIGALVGDAYYVKAADNPYVVTVGKHSVETLTTQTPDQFVKMAGAPPAGGAPGMPRPGMPGMPPGGMQGMPPGMMPGQ